MFATVRVCESFWPMTTDLKSTTAGEMERGAGESLKAADAQPEANTAKEQSKTSRGG